MPVRFSERIIIDIAVPVLSRQRYPEEIFRDECLHKDVVLPECLVHQILFYLSSNINTNNTINATFLSTEPSEY